MKRELNLFNIEIKTERTKSLLNRSVHGGSKEGSIERSVNRSKNASPAMGMSQQISKCHTPRRNESIPQIMNIKEADDDSLLD